MGLNAESILATVRHRRIGALLVLAVFFFLLRTWGGSVALFWGTLAASVLLRLEARPIFLVALLVLVTTPFLYLADRPAHAERAGVLAFSLLALGIVVDVFDTYRTARDRSHAVRRECSDAASDDADHRPAETRAGEASKQ